jgi:hypothetical protein
LEANVSVVPSVFLLRKLNPLTGALTAGFSISLPETLSGYALDGKGGIWVAGEFNNTFNGVPTGSPVKLLLATGQIDPNIPLMPVGQGFSSFLALIDGKLYFQERQERTPRNVFLVRRSENGGTTEAAWQVLITNGSARSICKLGNNIAIGGDFLRIGESQNRNSFAVVPMRDIIFIDGVE